MKYELVEPNDNFAINYVTVTTLDSEYIVICDNENGFVVLSLEEAKKIALFLALNIRGGE